MVKSIKVIINADDLGMSTAVNDQTFELMGLVKTTSATMIANGPFISNAFEKLNRYPQCSFGVHLNITEFVPLTANASLQPLVGDNGHFVGYDLVRNAKSDHALKKAVLTEFCDQIDLCRATSGVVISHIDSHHHVHTIPWIFPIIKQVQKKFNIRKIRISQNLYQATETISPSLRFKKSVYNFLLKHYIKTATTNYMGSFMAFHDSAMLNIIRQGTVEVMIHPGQSTYEGSTEEIELLRTGWENRLPFAIQLINYHDLN